LEGLKRGDEFEKIMLQQGTRGEFEKEVRGICRDRNIPLQIVPKEKLQSYTQKNHQGVIGITSPLAYQELETIFEAVKAKNEIPMFVLLDAVTDVRNIGAIARSAEISGVHALVVSKKNVASINAEAMKASAGALNLLSVCRVSSLMAAVEYLQAQGVQVVAAEMEAKKLLRHIDFSLPTAVVMGAEGRGINNDLLRKMSDTFRIPMLGKTESFNVSVATGIVLYEANRQRCD
jgi:23S rRNA (guanosine2251-2'-O)-methyltransferase